MIVEPRTNLRLYGTNHTRTGVDQREQISFAGDEIPAVLGEILKNSGVHEAAIISTCNRLEFLLVTEHDVCVPRLVREILQKHRNVDIRAWSDAFYFYQEMEVVQHTYRVVCSLDSMVIGEVDIAHQMKEMYQLASRAGATGHILNRLFHQAFGVGKQARSSTEISTGTTSVAVAAVDLVCRTAGPLSGKDALVVGGGKMGAQLARYLHKRGVGSLAIANRTLSRIEHIARQTNALTLTLDDVLPRLSQVDIVMVGLSHDGEPLISAADLKAHAAQNGRKLIVVDISVPRAVAEPESPVNGVAVYDIGSLEGVLDSDYRRREAAAKEVESIIEQAALRFEEWYREAAILPDVIALRRKVHEIYESELAKRASDLPEDQRQLLRQFAKSMSERIIQLPVGILREAVVENSNRNLLESFRRLFGIEETSERERSDTVDVVGN